MSSERQKNKRSLICLSDSEEEEEEATESDDDDYEDDEGNVSGFSDEESDEDDNRLDGDDDNDDVESLCNRVICLLKERGDLGALSLQECKAYLRKHSLRVSGTKAVCIQRIKEHWRLRDGNGEALYPKSSFFINCTGDVCRGDVVLFTQKVYEKFDKVTRHGRVVGKRTVAGRVIHESYGAAKQQHTFTIEIFWSKGINKLPPLFPLLVKGRNLYKLRTFRQRWNNEAEREKVLAEKHKRGSAARSVRAKWKTKKTWPDEGAKRQKHSHHTGSSQIRKTTVSNRGKSVDGIRKAIPPRPAKFNSYHRQVHSPGNQHLKQNARSAGSQFSLRHENFHHRDSRNGPALQSYTPLQRSYQSQMEFHHNNAPFYFPGHGMPYTSTTKRSPHFNPYTDAYVMPTSRYQGFNHHN